MNNVLAIRIHASMLLGAMLASAEVHGLAELCGDLLEIADAHTQGQAGKEMMGELRQKIATGLVSSLDVPITPHARRTMREGLLSLGELANAGGDTKLGEKFTALAAKHFGDMAN